MVSAEDKNRADAPSILEAAACVPAEIGDLGGHVLLVPHFHIVGQEQLYASYCRTHIST